MRVCVVGAGSSGLTTIKQLLDEGHDVTCYDKNADIGGLWLRDEGDEEKMKAYDDLYLTISMKLMAYSDFPFEGRRVFYRRSQYFDYLRRYADRFGLREHIRFGTAVTDLHRHGDSWTVSVEEHGVVRAEEFDAVAICSGPFKTPKTDIPGLDGFTGDIVHSAHYRNNERFRGKRVLVVGLGESAADVVREVGDVAESCTLAIRSYTWLLPRVYNGPRTTDHGTVRSHHHEMLRRSADYPFHLNTFWGRNRIVKFVFLAMSVVLGFTTTALGVFRSTIGPHIPIPEVNPFGQSVEPPMLDLNTPHTDENWQAVREWNHKSHPDGSWVQRSIFCKNVTFIPHIVSGKVVVNDSGIGHSDGNTVTFQDSTTGDYDIVLLCTGFSAQNISIGDLHVKDGNVRNLYKHFLHPEHQGTAAFIGFIRPLTGAVPTCAEMQARYFARVLSGKLAVPADIDERIGRDKEWEEHWTALSPTHPEAIPSQVLYLDSLAAEIGCLLPWWRLVLNPKLFIQVWFGSFNQSCYRIVGPHNRGRAALDDLYSEEIENRRDWAFNMSLLQLMPTHVHPERLI